MPTKKDSPDTYITESSLRRILGILFDENLQRIISQFEEKLTTTETRLADTLTCSFTHDITGVISDLAGHIDERFNRIERRLDRQGRHTKDIREDVAVHAAQIERIETWRSRQVGLAT